MASAPTAQLPVFYQDLLPLSTKDHAGWRMRKLDTAKFLVGQHAVPLASEEFIPASRHYPIVFSSGDNPIPLALMGLNEGVNTIVDDEGKLNAPVYIPAYVRRYPFLLARLRADSEDLSLCFDPTSDAVGKFKDGDPLFNGEELSPSLQNALSFCEQFEQAGILTSNFMKEVMDLDILMEGEVAIQQEGVEKPFIYRGFRMVDEAKLHELRGDTLRKLAQNGILPLLYAHLFSLQLVREVFARQVMLGKMPGIAPTGIAQA